AVQKRAFSISSSPLSDFVEITVKKTQNPFISSYLVDFLKVGEKVIAAGPYGRFYFNEKETENNLLLLGAGSGIAPLISIIHYISEKNFPINIVLLYSNKSETDILWRKEIELLAEKNKFFRHLFTITQDINNNSWTGQRGRITPRIIADYLSDSGKTDCYLCGPLEFVRNMEEMLLNLNIQKEKIKKEIYE
ncbi:MAG: FAD-dependent oxidoreductase, partial [Nanoarchaeota archaeon]